MNCPRDPTASERTWYPDHTCSYCGSLDPEVVLDLVAAGDVVVEGTDKNYKMYVKGVPGGTPLTQYYRNCPDRSACEGPDTCTHWVLREISMVKCYFFHFSVEQRARFVDLYNARTMKFARGGGFNVLPFFVVACGPGQCPE